MMPPRTTALRRCERVYQFYDALELTLAVIARELIGPGQNET